MVNGDIVRGSCVDVIESITSKIEKLPKEQQKTSVGPVPSQQIVGIVDSVLDKEKRKNNVVVHNLSELPAETHADRVAQDRSQFNVVERLCEEHYYQQF